ncbi:MAG: acetylornithine deacetylase/succinyl-diaminopimelate desuccinylase family protein [Acidobacteria bacterium]|nr:acetylornithine deacetylase/succinyl-diaminopimelate desuccinylase family protein [Acidobacteriota bacterium]
MNLAPGERVLREVERATDELVEFAAALVRVPTINPPGECYEVCARLLGDRLRETGFHVEELVPKDRVEHSSRYPRVNVVGRRGTSTGSGGGPRSPVVHLNGHLDVVPPGEGWTCDPFGGEVRDGRLYGRGSSDMKAGIAAAVYAAEALRRADIPLAGGIEISGTVDEESGGLAGVAWLAEQGHLSASQTDYVIIPEPFGPSRICVGHRGVYWFDLVTTGRTAHGSMPFLGVNAIDAMTVVLEAIRSRLAPRLASRTTALPVVPSLARQATLNLNSISGGQTGPAAQTPCVPDRCVATFDRRFLPEERFESVKAEFEQLLAEVADEHPGLQCELRDRMVVQPLRTPDDSLLVRALSRAAETVTGSVTLVASPGTYDHKHVVRLAGIEQCVAYGPGALELAHQPDEWCRVDDIVRATQVLALTLLELVGVAASRD